MVFNLHVVSSEEAFRFHVHHYQCLVVPVDLGCDGFQSSRSIFRRSFSVMCAVINVSGPGRIGFDMNVVEKLRNEAKLLIQKSYLQI